MTREQLAKKSIGLLLKVLEEAHEHLHKPGELREAFVYRHARNISNLAQDVVFLQTHDRFHSSPIILRSMLEGLFKMAAAANVAEASAAIAVSEIDDEVLRINQWSAVSGVAATDLDATIQQLTALAQDLRIQHGIQSKKKWNALECADSGGLVLIYRQLYFSLSKHTHVTASGIIAQENDVVFPNTLDAAIFIVVCAVGQLAQVVETRTPQQHVDNAADLLEKATELIQTKRTS